MFQEMSRVGVMGAVSGKEEEGGGRAPGKSHFPATTAASAEVAGLGCDEQVLVLYRKIVPTFRSF